MVVNWRRHISLATAFALVSSLVVTYFYFTNRDIGIGEMLSSGRYWKNVVFSFLLSILIYGANLMANTLLCLIMDKRDEKAKVPLSRKFRNVAYFVNGLITSIVSYYILLNFFLWLFFDVPFKWESLQISNFISVTIISLFILLVVFVFSYNDQLRLLELKNKEMEIALQKSQIESMKEQLSPHFLFNNMNVLISTIQEDPVKAEQFARSFSKIYRYVLEKLDYTSCTLSDELAFIKDYVYLLNVRYDNAIDFKITDEVMKYADVQLPTLSLQILIENVVKHNVIPSDGKIKVVLRIEEEGLVLWNERCAKPKQVYSSGVGLQNLSKRSLLLFNKDIEVKDLEDSFSVKIPLFRSNAS
ncbi:MAG: histidine kinase [Flavobacteriaceae bacterium]|jgi:sensor histidine kinase YesM|nr:histidine kinase [Flavobacteriaceae bacterium]